ncbi:MAG: hypothetical protein R2758_07105 [Bacteroidales bacterium]
MKLKVIKTEKEYKAAVERMYELIPLREQIEADSSKGEELELLSILVERYEDEQFPKRLLTQLMQSDSEWTR